MTIVDGKAEARINSAVYEATPSMRDALGDILNGQFLAFQLFSHKSYDLSSPTMIRLHSDGRKDSFLEVGSAKMEIVCGEVDFQLCDKEGIVVVDTKRDRIEKIKGIADLVRKFQKDEILVSMLKSHNSSLRDPNNELLYLYEIRDALSRKFGGEKVVISALKTISHSDWSWFGNLCNEEPLRQGRHRGKKYCELRDATNDELSKARGIAQAMIEGYFHYLDTTI
jgi:hypothetical protein